MKKIYIHLCLLLCAFLIILPACNTQSDLINHVSELRSDVFFGQNQTYSVKAGYGFKETPYNNDAKVSQKVYQLTFILLNRQADPATFSLTFNFKDKEYNALFKLNPISHALSATVNVEGFDLKSFEVIIRRDSDSQTVTLNSLLPADTITYQQALDNLEKNQKDLIDSYRNSDGNFCAEIYVRVLVKDQKAYYYVGFASGNQNLKALLIDGKSGKVLAVREIF